MALDLKEIQELIKFVAKSGACEVALEIGEMKISIKSEGEKVYFKLGSYSKEGSISDMDNLSKKLDTRIDELNFPFVYTLKGLLGWHNSMPEIFMNKKTIIEYRGTVYAEGISGYAKYIKTHPKRRK